MQINITTKSIDSRFTHNLKIENVSLFENIKF